MRAAKTVRIKITTTSIPLLQPALFPLNKSGFIQVHRGALQASPPADSQTGPH